jgi:predicted nuclease of predicted toxin-antitoxin system
MPLSPMLAKWLTESGHDAVHAVSIGLDRAPDTELIVRARQEARIIITADLDYPRLLALGAAVEPSLILFCGGNWSDNEIIARMSALLGAMGESDFEQSVFVIEPNRVRRRRLPIG